MGKYITGKEFIEKALLKHGKKYNYLKVNYIKSIYKVIITCKEHGDFLQSPNKHLNGHGCPKCGLIKNCKSNTHTQEQFINKANEIHQNKYEYKNVKYLNSTTKINITCKIHGDFVQSPASHLSKNGCPLCGKTTSGERHRITKENLLKRFKDKHGDKYQVEDFTMTTLTGGTKITIICPKHGKVIKSITNHLRCGCSKCGNDTISFKTRKIPKELERVCANLRRRVKSYISRGGYKKQSSTTTMIGLPWEDLMRHLNNNPYKLKVNDTDVDLDHIIPLKSAKSLDELILLNHYTNLQLLPSYYNRFIKIDKTFNKKDFEMWLVKSNFRKYEN